LSEFNDNKQAAPGSRPGTEQGNGLSDPPPPSGGEGVELQVRRIQDKLQQLLKQRDTLLKENGKLKEEVRQMQQEQTRHAIRLEQLQQQVEIVKATKETMSEGEKRALDKRLGQYIREIDRCIALLSE
jgi:chromosome segregation ATPase